jgi:uncharacterized protein with von Willebrand factor type A (vWA) domain
MKEIEKLREKVDGLLWDVVNETKTLHQGIASREIKLADSEDVNRGLQKIIGSLEKELAALVPKSDPQGTEASSSTTAQ